MRFTSLELDSLRNQLVEQLRDLCSAETQLAGTLQLTLNEETQAGMKLISIAESQVNISAASRKSR